MSAKSRVVAINAIRQTFPDARHFFQNLTYKSERWYVVVFSSSSPNLCTDRPFVWRYGPLFTYKYLDYLNYSIERGRRWQIASSRDGKTTFEISLTCVAVSNSMCLLCPYNILYHLSFFELNVSKHYCYVRKYVIYLHLIII